MCSKLFCPAVALLASQLAAIPPRRAAEFEAARAAFESQGKKS